MCEEKIKNILRISEVFGLILTDECWQRYEDRLKDYFKEHETDKDWEISELKEKVRIMSIGQPWLGDDFHTSAVETYKRLKKVAEVARAITQKRNVADWQGNCSTIPNSLLEDLSQALQELEV